MIEKTTTSEANRSPKAPLALRINSLLLCTLFAASSLALARTIAAAERALYVYGLCFAIVLLMTVCILQIRASFFNGAIAGFCAGIICFSISVILAVIFTVLLLYLVVSGGEAGILHIEMILVFVSAYLALSAKATMRWSTELDRPAAGRCPQCGYDLRATPDRCPECGTAVEKTKDHPRHGANEDMRKQERPTTLRN